MNRIHLFSLIAFFTLTLSQETEGYIFLEKTVRPRANVTQNCLNLLHNSNVSQIKRCDFFKCFEDRFPCGKDYWIQNWGRKYCLKHADKNVIKQFTKEGIDLIKHLDRCLPNKLEKYYLSKKSIKCKTLTTNMFIAQGECYDEVRETFCKAFPDNMSLFMKILDFSDLWNENSLKMINKIGANCVPKINFSSFQ